MNLMALLIISIAPKQCPAIFYGQPSAVLWKDQLFVAVGTTYYSGALYRGTFAPDSNRVRSPVVHINPTAMLFSRQAKLDVRGDRVLLFGAGPAGYVIAPIVDLPLFEDSALGQALLEARGFPNWFSLLYGEFAGHPARVLFPFHRKPDVSAPETPQPGVHSPELRDERRAHDYTRFARMDLQLAGAKSVRAFHAFKDKIFVSIEPDYLNNWYLDGEGRVAKDLPKPPNRELRTGRLPADFTEFFAAYTAGKQDYLVTNNGKVYLCVPKGKDGVEVTALRTDPKQRITGVVQDPANDAVYGWGFAGADGSADRFYVKLEPKPVAVPYKLTVPLWNDRSDAYLESYECARAFRKAAEKK